MRFRQALTLLVVVISVAGCKIDTAGPSPSSSPLSEAPAQTTGSATMPSPAAGFQVTDLVVRADPFQISTTCPATITFSGRISVAGGSGIVTYRWLRSDGAQAPVQELRITKATKQDVVTTWTLGSPGTKYTGWQAIEIIRPKHQVSERASFTLTCT